MTEIHVSPGPAYVGPVGGGPWRELGYVTDSLTYTIEDEFTPEDFEALKRGLAGGQTITTTFTMNRRQFNRLYHIMTGSRRLPRNRRRNPLHAVRDRLRYERRQRRGRQR